MANEATVTTDRAGPVVTVLINRPDRRNAVDGPTATLLADAMRAFDADPEWRVAVLAGAGGTLCAGADLHAYSTPAANRLEPDGDGTMGPTRLRLAKPVIAATHGYAAARRLEPAP